jgi:hypothetical protein
MAGCYSGHGGRMCDTSPYSPITWKGIKGGLAGIGRSIVGTGASLECLLLSEGHNPDACHRFTKTATSAYDHAIESAGINTGPDSYYRGGTFIGNLAIPLLGSLVAGPEASGSDLLDASLAAEDGASDVLATPQVENSKLQNVVNDLYKGTTNPNRVGTGTTADAVRSELETGEPTGGTFHFEKAAQYSTALSNLLKSGNLNPYDQLVARSLFEDLQSALGNRP